MRLAALVGVVLLAVGLWRPALAPARVRAAAAGALAIFQATVLWLDGAALTGVLRPGPGRHVDLARWFRTYSDAG